MNTLRFSLLFVILLTVISCNKLSEDTPDEDYTLLFGKKEIPQPEYDLITMPRQQCDPILSEGDYVYPGKDVTQKRVYTVTVRFWFKEQRVQNESINQVQSDIELRYIDQNKKLVKKDTYNEQGFKSGELFEHTFTAESGFPLYLGIHGAGFELFEMSASVQAVSTDGLIKTPLLQYGAKLYSDGYSDDLNYCEKIILP